MNIKTIKQSVLTIVIGLALAAGISFAAPTANPPSGNVPAPINVGGGAQAKSGFLAVGTSALPTVSLNVAGASNFTGLAQFTALAKFTSNPALQITNNAASGRVLTSDATGTASWGRPFPAPDYNSGWVSIGTGDTSRICPGGFTAGELENALIVLDGKGLDESIHQANFGTDDSTGASWAGLSGGCLVVKRGGNDSAVNDNKKWKKYRLRIWKTAL